MSYNPHYDPDDNAKPVGKLFTRQLSQRDLSLSIPVNFVEHAGISLTAACFAHQRYVEAAAQRCLSNLLAIGFHRYEVDLFWDVSRQVWSLCPVEMGGVGVAGDGDEGDETATTTTATTGQTTEIDVVAMSTTGAAAPTRRDAGGAWRRQATTENTGLDIDTLTTPTATFVPVGADETSITSSSLSSTLTATSSSSDSSTALAASNGSDYQQLGPYQCSESVDLDWLSRVMWTYLDTTETNLNATLRYLILNLHAASPASDPTGSAGAPSSADLPNEDDSLSSVMASNLSSFLYTPSDLENQRANINASWYSVPLGMDPTVGYYRTHERADAQMTGDGWPSENYVEMQQGKRLFVGFGSIDPQMRGYDLSDDDEVVFAQNYLQDMLEIDIEATGDVTSGCFYQPEEYSLAQTNNSWAFTTSGSQDLTQPELLVSSSNITRCGISPVLDVMLQNATADENFLPYQTYLQSSIWSWAPGYPRISNTSHTLPDGQSNMISDSPNTDNDDQTLGEQARCAALNATSGFWQNIVCDTSHYSACRRAGSLYDWTISADDASYTKAGLSCREGTDFDVPRTGLQNTYLVHTWRSFLSSPDTDASVDDGPGNEMLWLNFNNLDSELCWVIGQNATCPYVNRRSGDRQVIVPVVAAVVVFALGVMTIFVKCAANRQMNKRQKRRRRGDDGWDYEGVPS